jgi:transposase
VNPTIAELTLAIEQEAEKSPQARRLMTHPGVGPLTALAFVLIIGKAERFQCGKQIAAYLGTGAVGGLERRTTQAGTYHQARQFSAALFISESGISDNPHDSGLAQ